MVLDLLTISTALPATIGTASAISSHRFVDNDSESADRQAPFYLDVYCDAKSKKRDEVHDAIVVLKDGKLRLWPKDPDTQQPKEGPEGDEPPHVFEGFYYLFPEEELPTRALDEDDEPVLGLVSTVPRDSSGPNSGSRPTKPKLNWIYADKDTRELKYGPRAQARKHVVGPWDWTEDDEQGLILDGEESFVAVEEDKDGYGWAVYWDKDDDRLQDLDIGKKKRVLRCSLERRLVKEDSDSHSERGTGSE